ncbi:MAG TPA: hypothetical protein VHA06_06390, partial [Candidatus Angelobacter sp.]|nr:hypothetical protein [Candidatus Angelobacter sp.]
LTLRDQNANLRMSLHKNILTRQRLQIRYYWISHIAAQYLFLLRLGTPGLARCRTGCEFREITPTGMRSILQLERLNLLERR